MTVKEALPALQGIVASLEKTSNKTATLKKVIGFIKFALIYLESEV